MEVEKSGKPKQLFRVIFFSLSLKSDLVQPRIEAAVKDSC